MTCRCNCSQGEPEKRFFASREGSAWGFTDRKTGQWYPVWAGERARQFAEFEAERANAYHADVDDDEFDDTETGGPPPDEEPKP